MRDVVHVAQKSRRRHDVAGRSLNWFDDNRSGSSGHLLFDDAPKLLDRMLAAFGLRAREPRRIGVGSEMVTGGQRSDQVLPIDVRKRENARGFSMETAGETDDVGSLRVGAGQSNRGFDCFGAAAEKLGARSARPAPDPQSA